MHHTTPVRHHPDIRWVIVVTMIITTAVVLFVYTMWDVTRPRPALVEQLNAQGKYIGQLQSTIVQLNTINDAFQGEINRNEQTIATLRTQLLAAQAVASSTNKKSPK